MLVSRARLIRRVRSGPWAALPGLHSRIVDSLARHHARTIETSPAARALRRDRLDGDEDEDEGEGAEKEDNSLIQFILKNPTLRLAFLLILVLLLLYVFFRAKRKEEILPGYNQKRNMSLAFVETLGSIYISRNSPAGVLQVMRKNFYSAINRHFYIDLSRKENREQQLEKLLAKVPSDSEKLLDIINSLDARKNNIDNRHLGVVYNKIRAFYIENGILHPTEHFVASDKEVELDKKAYHKAMESLARLEKENPVDAKVFYTELVNIFRTYLKGAKDIQSFSKTTDDLSIQLQSQKLPAADYNALVQTLRLSDLVKFAAYRPDNSMNQQSLSIIKQSITTIEQAHVV